MKIPKTFVIKGHKWKVKYKNNLHHEDGDAVYALCDKETKTIIIDGLLNEEQMILSFWHEYAHAILDSLHIVAPADGGMNETQEGVFCEGFADIMTNEWDIKPKRKRKRNNE